MRSWIVAEGQPKWPLWAFWFNFHISPLTSRDPDWPPRRDLKRPHALWHCLLELVARKGIQVLPWKVLMPGTFWLCALFRVGGHALIHVSRKETILWVSLLIRRVRLHPPKSLTTYMDSLQSRPGMRILFKPWNHKMNRGGRVEESKGLGFFLFFVFLFFSLAGLDSFSNNKQVRCTVEGDLRPALDYYNSLLVGFLALW